VSSSLLFFFFAGRVFLSFPTSTPPPPPPPRPRPGNAVRFFLLTPIFFLSIHL
jgi:hypothetical protein